MPRSTESNADDFIVGTRLSYSQVAILLVGLTSLGKYHSGENYAVQTHTKELILLSQKSLLKLKNPRLVYTLFILKCFIYQWTATFLTSAIWFVRIYVIQNSSRKNGYYE